MIKLKNVSRNYVNNKINVHAVNNVSLEVKAGEIYGVIGASGAGKSTLVRCINLLERPDSGQVFLEDVDLTTLNKKELRAAREKIGMIFQQFNLFNASNVFDNIAYALKYKKIDKAVIKNRVNELAHIVGLEDKLTAYPAQLSGGQKQRVAIARALASEPKVLLCDEATSALDPEITKNVLDLLKDLNKRLNLTLVVITHEMSVVKQLCDSVAIMSDGEIIESGNVYSIFANPQKEQTRAMIESHMHFNNMGETLRNEIQAGSLNMGSKLLRLSYGNKTVATPLVSYISRNFDVNVNILYGNIEKIQGNTLGGLIVSIEPIQDGDTDGVDNSLAYLVSQDVQVEVI